LASKLAYENAVAANALKRAMGITKLSEKVASAMSTMKQRGKEGSLTAASTAAADGFAPPPRAATVSSETEIAKLRETAAELRSNASSPRALRKANGTYTEP
jgi:hypothetical protein